MVFQSTVSNMSSFYFSITKLWNQVLWPVHILSKEDIDNYLQNQATGQARLIRTYSSANFSFEISGIRINSII